MSRRLISTALGFFILAVTPPLRANAQSGLGLAGGASMPRGDFGRFTNSGYHITALMSVRVPAAPIGFRLEGSFSQYAYDRTLFTNDAQARIIYGTANAVLSAPGNSAPYAIAGFGIYHSSAECSRCTTTGTKGGVNAGIGYRLGLTGFSAFVEARYHYIAGPNDPTNGGLRGSNTQFVPLSVGVMF